MCILSIDLASVACSSENKIYTVCMKITVFYNYQIDRLFEWRKQPNVQVEETAKNQKKMTKQEFDERSGIVINQFAEQVYIFLSFFFSFQFKKKFSHVYFDIDKLSKKIQNGIASKNSS